MSGADPTPKPAHNLPQAQVAHRRRVSWIWAIPLVTLLVAGWLAYDTLSKRGPTIVITLDSSEGLVPGQSHVEHRGINLGLVDTIVLAKGSSHVIVTAKMTRDAEALLTEGAKTWVVQPRLFAGSLTGVSTLLSGTYLELLPGAEGAAPVRGFVGLEDPPVMATDVPGQTVMLTSERIGSVSVGSPVFYRDLAVGEVLGWDINDLAKSVTVHAFIRAPFDRYVREDSHFWNASGVAVKMGASGVQLQMESVKALLLGGVAFETPEPELDKPASPGPITRVFPLFDDHEAAINAGFHRHIQALSYFKDSVDGLAVGSPVTFHGLRVGEVTSVDLEYDTKLDAIVAPVHYRVEPDRVGNITVVQNRGPLENIGMLVKKGMRAQLKTSNLLTGQKEIAVDILTDPEPAELRVDGTVFIIPSAPGGLSGITDAATKLMSKLSQMPFDQIGRDLDSTLHGASVIANNPDLAKTIASLQGVATSAKALVDKIDAGAGPALRELPAIAKSLETAVNQAARTMASVNQGYGDDSKFRGDLDKAILQLTDAVRSVRVLADLLARDPEALVRGRSVTGKE